MPSPRIATGDLDHVPLGIGEHLDQISGPLQTGFGGAFGLGKWQRFALTEVVLGTSLATARLTATNATGQLAYTVIGDTMILQLDATNGFTLTGAPTFLTIQLPDNWQYAPRLADELVGARAVGPGALIYDGSAVQNVGYLALTADQPRRLIVSRGIGSGAFTAGVVYVLGHIAFECQQIGERA